MRLSFLLFLSVLFVLVSLLPIEKANAYREERNILIIITDDQRKDSLAKMPILSGGDWIEFSHAFYNNPLCCPSRATIFSGQYSHHTKVVDNDEGEKLDEKQTIASYLNKVGYRTALIGKYLNGYPFGRTSHTPEGWDQFMIQTKGQYFNWQLEKNGKTHYFGEEEGDYSTDVLGRLATNYIKRVSDQPDPFFLTLAFKAPHGPTIPAPRHRGYFADEPVLNSPSFNEEDVSDKPKHIRESPLVTKAATDQVIRAEWESLLAVDQQIENVRLALEETGELDNTMIIFLSDNGISHGEHRITGKRCPYDECLANPLLLKIPGVSRESSPAMTSNADLLPTILDWIDYPTQNEIKVDGYSLLKEINSNTNVNYPVLLQSDARAKVKNAPSYWGLRTRKFLYTHITKTQEQELYDLAKDPYQLDNLAKDPNYQQVRESLANKTRKLRKKPLHSLKEAYQGHPF